MAESTTPPPLPLRGALKTREDKTKVLGPIVPRVSLRRDLSYLTERLPEEMQKENAEREKRRAHAGWLCSVGSTYVPFGPPDLHLRYSKRYTRRQSTVNPTEAAQQQELIKKKKAMIRGRDDLIYELEEYLAEEEVEEERPVTQRGEKEARSRGGYSQLWAEIRGADLRRKKCRAGKSVLDVTRISAPHGPAQAAAAAEGAAQSRSSSPGASPRTGGHNSSSPGAEPGSRPDQSRPSTSGDPPTNPASGGEEAASEVGSVQSRASRVSRASRASRRTVLGADGQPQPQQARVPHPPRHAPQGHASVATARLPGQSMWPPRWEKSLQRFVENVIAPQKAAAAAAAKGGGPSTPGRKKKGGSKGRPGELPEDLFPPNWHQPEGDVRARRREFAERKVALDQRLLRDIEKLDEGRPNSMLRRLQAVDSAVRAGGGGAALALHAQQMDLSARAAALAANDWWPGIVKLVFEKKASGTRPTAVEIRLLKQIKKDLEEGTRFTADKLYEIVLSLSLREQLSERVQYFINALREVVGVPPKTWRTWLDKNELPVPNFLLVMRDPALEDPRGSLQTNPRRSRLASVASVARSADLGSAAPPPLDGAGLQKAVSRLEVHRPSGAQTAR